jgi:hypothetical protein
MIGYLAAPGAWLAPVGWLAVSSLMLTDGPGGVWVGLVLVLAPLAALSMTPAGPIRPEDDRASAFGRVVAMAVSGMLLWANLALAGDIASALGASRWEGVALALGGALLVTAWPALGRAGALALALSGVALAFSLAALALASGLGPLAAWEAVASREAMRFGPNSQAVTAGYVVGARRAPLVFEEEHRVTAPDGGILRVLIHDGAKPAERSLTLGPGQSVTLRPGDALLVDAGVRLRFEARRRVPGAPPSGVAWADGYRGGWAARLGLATTLLGGAMGLLAGGGGPRRSRRAIGVIGAALLAAFLWAQGWAVYSLLLAPEVFLGGATPARLVEMPVLALGGGPAARPAQIALLVAIFVGVVATAKAWLDVGGNGHGAGRATSARDLAFRALAIVIAGLGSLGPVEPWPLMLLALGAGGAALAPTALSAGAPGRAGVVAGTLGLLVFVGVGVSAWVYPARSDVLTMVGRFPAMVALPVALLALPLVRRATG